MDPVSVADRFATDIETLVSTTSARVLRVVERSAPTVDYLRKLGDALLGAARDPARAHEVDPDRLWHENLWPRALATTGDAVDELALGVGEVAGRVRQLESELEGWVRQEVWGAGSAAAAEPVARSAMIEQLAGRLDAAHQVVATFARTAPSVATVEGVESTLAEHRRRRAGDDVRRDRKAWLAEAGGDAQHQRLAELQWETSLPERVAYRDNELRAEMPWRHQELALAAHRQALSAIAARSSAMAEHAAEPLFGIGERLVRLYDDLVVGRVR